MKTLWESLRPRQWTKNLFLFAGILFSRNLTNPAALWKVIAAFGLFCLLSGAVYLMNDLIDREADRRHPVKSRRPIASGRLSIAWAQAVLIVLIPFCLGAATLLSRPFFLTVLGYLGLQVTYFFLLKEAVILDVFAIAGGFALRVLAGAAVIEVEVSSWFLICTIFLSLFLGLGKRRQELVTGVGSEHRSRPVLGEYSPSLLDQMISVVAASTVVTYALYTMSEETILRFGSRDLVLTVPFVVYGILRYLYLIHQKGIGEEPEAALLTDRPLLVASLLWVLVAAAVIYG